MAERFDCVFCNLLDAVDLGVNETPIEYDWGGVVAFEPLNPVTDGHLLVVPERHVAAADEDPWLTARVMYHASQVAAVHNASNIITSCGAEASQTVFHLHVHVVPRRHGDGLVLPWTSQEATS